MADLKPEDVLNIPGRIALSPTDLSAAYPHGGSAVGIIGDVVYEPNYQYRPFLMREGGKRGFDLIEVPSDGMLTVLCRQWDPEVIGSIYPASTTQTDGSELGRVTGSSNRFIGSNGIKIAYSPLDETKKGVLFYHAIPTIMRLRLAFARNIETVHLASFYLLRDSSDRYAAVETMANLNGVLS